ncbi:hypothetical protein GCM10012287_31790 [Streptomyces daqingensis]|uniref:F5/8 type C domain-containing protein n=1 Tax=Streptomyces daqingensis TaxID=1472640 RepID=A0ABQ2MG40_9ACTN|nr:hypothetical protein GCM10012287_31790 [Streptomyces daqingensis]
MTLTRRLDGGDWSGVRTTSSPGGSTASRGTSAIPRPCETNVAATFHSRAAWATDGTNPALWQADITSWREVQLLPGMPRTHLSVARSSSGTGASPASAWPGGVSRSNGSSSSRRWS